MKFDVQKKKGSRRWNHKSVIHLINESGKPGERPEEIITRRARLVVNKGRRLGWSGPPFDVPLLADLLGIHTQENSEIVAEAQIIPVGGQFELLFRTDVTATRLNFTFAHEISHTLFPDCGQMIHERNTTRSRFDPEREVERLCDVAAGQIILPYPFFENDLKSLGGGLKDIDELSSIYGASREAIIHRISSVELSTCAVVYFSYGYNKEETVALTNKSNLANEAIPPRLRIASVFPSKLFLPFLPKKKSIPDDSVLYKLLSGERYVSCKESWNIKDFGTRLVEGIRLYHAKSAERLGIVALIH